MMFYIVSAFFVATWLTVLFVSTGFVSMSSKKLSEIPSWYIAMNGEFVETIGTGAPVISEGFKA